MQASARLGLLLLMVLTTAAGAQHVPTGIAGPRPTQVLDVGARGPLRQSLALDSVRRDIRPTQWKKGALIGGVVTGVGFVLLLDVVCSGSNAGCGGGAVPAALVAGGALGALVGALIGGQFPKAEGP